MLVSRRLPKLMLNGCHAVSDKTFRSILRNSCNKTPTFHLQAGMQAVRENRYVVLAKDFEKGYKNNVKKDDQELEFYK